jgi:hypothetical protein
VSEFDRLKAQKDAILERERLDAGMELRGLCADMMRERDQLRADLERVGKERDELAEELEVEAERTQAVDDENARMRTAFKQLIETISKGAPLDLNFSGCEWCGELWPKVEGQGVEETKERARHHLLACASHPLKARIAELEHERVAPTRTTATRTTQGATMTTPLTDAELAELETLHEDMDRKVYGPSFKVAEAKSALLAFAEVACEKMPHLLAELRRTGVGR